MEKKRKTLGFALGAGGACGVAHVGFLRAMEEAGIYPDYIAGCSMGSVVGSVVGSVGAEVPALAETVQLLPEALAS